MDTENNPSKQPNSEQAQEAVISTGEQLTSEERQQYAMDLGLCKQHERGFLQMGKALYRINAQRLYREKYRTFRDFLEGELPNLAKSQAYAIINAWELYREMSDVSDKAGFEMFPRTAREVRELNRLASVEEKREALQRANAIAQSAGRKERQDKDTKQAVSDMLTGRGEAEEKPTDAVQTTAVLVEPERVKRDVDRCVREVRAHLPHYISTERRDWAMQGVRYILRMALLSEAETIRRILRDLKKQAEAASQSTSTVERKTPIRVPIDSSMASKTMPGGLADIQQKIGDVFTTQNAPNAT